MNGGHGRTAERRYQIRDGYVVRTFMEEHLVVPVGAPGEEGSKMAVLSPVAEFIWTLLQTPHSVEEILSAVIREFEVSPAEAEADIREFLQELEDHHFLKREDEAL